MLGFNYLNDKIASIPQGMCMNIEYSDFREAAEGFISSNIFDSVRANNVEDVARWMSDFHNVDIIKILPFGNPYRVFYKVCAASRENIDTGSGD